jgi:hypothetical protein
MKNKKKYKAEIKSLNRALKTGLAVAQSCGHSVYITVHFGLYNMHQLESSITSSEIILCAIDGYGNISWE